MRLRTCTVLTTAIALALLSGEACSAIQGAPLRENEGIVAGSDGAKLRYTILGTGRDTIVVLHGGPGFHSGYLVRPLAPLALKGHTLIFYDLRGRGRSELVDSSRISASNDVADLESVRRHFRIAKLTLIGHGWGGALAALYAERYPTHVERVAMISPLVPRPLYAWGLSLLPSDSSALRSLADARRAHVDSIDPARFCRQEWGWQFLPARVTETSIVAALAPDMCDLPPASLRRVELVNRQILRSLGGQWDFRKTAAAMRVPLLVVEGNTQPVLVDAMREWAVAAPNARAVHLNASGTVPWLPANRGFVDALDEFVSGSWPLLSELIHTPTVS